MRAGGTFNTKVFQADLNEIQSGQYATSNLIHLPLLTTFHALTGSTTPFGGRPDTATATAQNPIVGNVASGAQILASRIQITEPANSLQLLWHVLDQGGNYQCSYPMNSPLNNYWDVNTNGHWAFGWLRVNGNGVWFPMSLMKSTDWIAAQQLGIFPYGGFNSISCPMSFVDWIGYWDGTGTITNNAYILAVTSVNTSLASNGGSLGDITNYATPSGSGTEVTPANTDTQRNQDILVRGGNGRS
jgi:hypothetical protein